MTMTGSDKKYAKSVDCQLAITQKYSLK